MLKEFIEKNKLTFEEGSRNTNAVVLCGFALWKGLSKADVCEAIPLEARTGELGTELERVWDYAEKWNYGEWWKASYNSSKYIL